MCRQISNMSSHLRLHAKSFSSACAWPCANATQCVLHVAHAFHMSLLRIMLIAFIFASRLAVSCFVALRHIVQATAKTLQVDYRERFDRQYY